MFFKPFIITVIALLCVVTAFADPVAGFQIKGIAGVTGFVNAVNGSSINICSGTVLTFHSKTNYTAPSRGVKSVDYVFKNGSPGTYKDEYNIDVQVSFNASGTVTQTVTDDAGKTDIITVNIVVSDTKPDPTITYTPQTPQCGYNDYTFTAKSGMAYYYWTFSGSTTKTSTQNPAVIKFDDATGTGTGTYNVGLTVIDDKGCSNSSSTTVSVKQVPDVTIASGNSDEETYNGQKAFTICDKTFSTFQFAFANKSSTFSSNSKYDIDWGDGKKEQFNNTTWAQNDSIRHTYSKGFYTLKITTTSVNGCANTRSYGVFLGSNPDGGISTVGSTSICAGDSIHFQINSYDKNADGTIYTVTINEQPPVVYTFTHAQLIKQSPTGPFDFWHKFTQASCGTNDGVHPVNQFTGSIHIVNPCPIPKDGATYNIYVAGGTKPRITMPATTCINNAVTLTSNTIWGTYYRNGDCFSEAGEVVWKIISPGGAIAPVVTSGNLGTFNSWAKGSQAINITFKSNGVYTIRLYARITADDASGCVKDHIDSSDQTICIRNRPGAMFALNQKTACAPFTVVATKKTPMDASCDGDDFEWTVKPLFVSNCAVSNDYKVLENTYAKASVSFNDPGKYEIRLTVKAKASGCDSTYADTIVINGRPGVSFGKPSPVCTGGSFTPKPHVDSCFSPTPITYLWTFNTGTGAPITTTRLDTSNIVFNKAGTYRITLKASNGCTPPDTTYVDSILVTGKADIGPIKDTTICSGDSVGLPLTSSNPAAYYSWIAKQDGNIRGITTQYNQPGGVLGDVLVNTANPAKSASADYKIWSLAAPGATCISDTVKVHVIVLPVDSAHAGADQYLCKDVTSTQLQATKPAVGGGVWTKVAGPAATIAKADDPNTNITGLQSNSVYTFVWTISGTATKCVVNTDTVLVSTRPIVNIIDTPAAICSGTSITLNGQQPTGGDSTAYAYQWEQSSDKTNFTPVTQNGKQQSLTINSPVGNVFYRRVITSHGCIIYSDTVQVIITSAIPVPSFTAKDSVGCATLQSPMTVTFTNNTPDKDKFTYRWNFGNGSTSTLADPPLQIFTTTASGYGDTTYFVTLEASNGCSPVTYKDTIVVKAQPPVLFAADDVLGCSGGVMLFTNVSVKAGTKNVYTWDFGDGTTLTTSDARVSHVYHNGPATTYYVTLSGQNDCGTHNSPPLAVTIDSNRIGFYVDVSSTNLYRCAGDTVHFFNKSTGATSFKWDFGDGTSIVHTVDNIETVNYVYKKPGVYTVTICASNNCTLDTCITKTITVAERPAASFTAQPESICAGGTVNFTNTSPTSNGTVFTWTFGDNTTPEHTYSTSHTYLHGGSDTVWLVASAQFIPGFPPQFSCPDSAFKVINVDEPFGELVYSDSSCQGLTVTFTAKSNNTKQYNFSFGDGEATQTTSNVVTHTYKQAGKYLPSVNLTGFSGNCTTTIMGADSINVDNITAAFSIDSVAVCDKTTIKVSDSSYSYFTASAYEWTVDGVSYNTGSVTKVLTQSAAVNVQLKVTGATGCVAVTQANVPVFVHQTPQGNITVNSDTCARDSVRFSAGVFSNEAVSYAWNFGNGDKGSGQNAATIFNPAGNYTVTLTSTTAFGCSSFTSRPVSIKTSPVITVPSDSVRICLGDMAQLSAAGQDVQVWSWNPNKGLSCTGCNAPQASPATTTLYTVGGTGSNGCTGFHNVLVNVVQPFKVSATPALTSVCMPGAIPTVQFFASGAYRYTWAPNTWLSDYQVANPVVTLPATVPTSTRTVYTVTGYDQYNCFTDVDSVVLSVGLTPTVELGLGDSGVAGRKVIVSPQTTNGPFSRFNWTIISGHGAVDCKGDPACAEPQVTVNSDMAIKVDAVNIFGCTGSDTIYYKAFCSNGEQLFIPTGFSPDGDNINDVLMVQGRGIIVEEFKVLNRWGQVIFSSGGNTPPNVPAYGWDGSVNGNRNNPAPPDVYVYLARVKCTASNEEFKIKNNVTLIRVKR